MLAGGGTTCVASVPTPDARDCDPPPDAVGGGGTGFVRTSPVAELPQLLRSRLTCDGGGATTAGAGSVSLGVDETSRCGAETGGATTSTVLRQRDAGIGQVALRVARSRCDDGRRKRVGGPHFVSRDIRRGGTTAAFIVALRVGEVRVGARETSGAGGMTLVVRMLGVCLVVDEEDEFNSGEGGTALIVMSLLAALVR